MLSAVKKGAHKFGYVAFKTETLNFREFCAGGSPEYVAAKQKLKDLHLKHKKERSELLGMRPKNIAYSLYINPLAFFDPTFIAIGAGIVLVAVIEHQLAKNGLIFLASGLSTILRIAFPIVAAASIIYLISHSSFLLF